MNKIKNLALVDDDEIFVFLTKMTIEESNIVDMVKVFRNGREAINFLNENSHDPTQLPEVILLDLSMPVMDGWQFLEEYIVLKPRIGKKIVIYIVSSSISPDDIQKAKNINEVTDYIIKPVTKEHLVEMLKNL
ncbi:MAG: response regulator [Bacteroidia bacterium]|nr:response regulator [Bacteroidia bacterium]